MSGFERFRRPAVILGLLGLAGAIAVMVWTGAGQVWGALIAVGLPAFIGLCLFTLAWQSLLGVAWAALYPDGWRRRLPAFVWARLVRDGGAEVLPLTPLAGMAAGGRVLTTHGLSASQATGATVVDVSLEFFAQIAFLIIGAGLALQTLAGDGDQTSRVGFLFAVTLGLAAVAAAGLVVAPRYGLAAIERLGARLHPGAAAGAGAVHATIVELYGRRVGVVVCFFLHLVAWLASAAWTAIALALLDAPVSLGAAVAIEALICAVRSAAFAVPVGLGVQEGAYALLAPMFGLPPEAAVALSLLKRARDLALGAPILAIWQIEETRRLRALPSGREKERVPR